MWFALVRGEESMNYLHLEKKLYFIFLLNFGDNLTNDWKK